MRGRACHRPRSSSKIETYHPRGRQHDRRLKRLAASPALLLRLGGGGLQFLHRGLRFRRQLRFCRLFRRLAGRVRLEPRRHLRRLLPLHPGQRPGGGGGRQPDRSLWPLAHRACRWRAAGVGTGGLQSVDRALALLPLLWSHLWPGPFLLWLGAHGGGDQPLVRREARRGHGYSRRRHRPGGGGDRAALPVPDPYLRLAYRLSGAGGGHPGGYRAAGGAVAGGLAAGTGHDA